MMEIGVILAFIVGLAELLKKHGLKKELIPLFNVLAGVITNLLLNGISTEAITYGLVMGLVASGLYDQSKICKLFKSDDKIGLS